LEGNGDSHEWNEDSRKSFRGNRITYLAVGAHNRPVIGA
jgi:hypothetical protein